MRNKATIRATFPLCGILLLLMGLGTSPLFLNAQNVGIDNNNPQYKLDVNGFAHIKGELTIGDTTGANYYTLPNTDGANNQVLKTDGAGTVSWQADSGGLQSVNTTNRLSGNGTSGSPLDIAQNGAISGEVLEWNGSSWVPATDNVDSLPGGTWGQTLRHNGSNWVATSALFSSGEYVGVNETDSTAGIYDVSFAVDNATGQAIDVNCTEGGGATEAIAIYTSARNSSSSNNYSYWGAARNSSGNNRAFHSPGVGGGDNAYIGGDLDVAGAKNFLVDHPDDPKNKAIRHTAVESNQALCMYRGKVQLDQNGEAVVTLPDYFPSLTDERNATVVLTPIGKPFAFGYEWQQDYQSFKVYGEKNKEVSYLVTAQRNDPVIQATDNKPGVIVKSEDPEFDQGELLRPTPHGYSIEMHEDWGVIKERLSEKEIQELKENLKK